MGVTVDNGAYVMVPVWDVARYQAAGFWTIKRMSSDRRVMLRWEGPGRPRYPEHPDEWKDWPGDQR